MYTVIRFSADSIDERTLVAFGEKLNAQRPRLFDGLDCVNGRFSCSICSDPSWESHRSAIHSFLQEFSEVLRKAKGLGLRVEIDVAIDASDYREQKTYFCIAIPPKRSKN